MSGSECYGGGWSCEKSCASQDNNGEDGTLSRRPAGRRRYISFKQPVRSLKQSYFVGGTWKVMPRSEFALLVAATSRSAKGIFFESVSVYIHRVCPTMA